MIKLSLLLSWFSFISCSTVTFLSTNKISTTFDYEDKNDAQAVIQVYRPFYMWGLYPKEHIIKVDEEFKQQGYGAVSDLIIQEVEPTTKAFWMILTFGMYYPQNFKLKAKVN